LRTLRIATNDMTDHHDTIILTLTTAVTKCTKHKAFTSYSRCIIANAHRVQVQGVDLMT
jgi:hypothetical protein